MKTIKSLLILLLGTIATAHAQEASVKSETNVNFNADKITYYQQGAEKINYELTLQLKLKPKKRLLKEQKRVRKGVKEKE
jgi:hypothetical protein